MIHASHQTPSQPARLGCAPDLTQVGLSDLDRAAFARDGYVVARGLLSAGDVSPVRNEIASWLTRCASDMHAAGSLPKLHEEADFSTRFGLLMAQNGAIQDGFDVMFLRGVATFNFFHTPALLNAVQSLIGSEISLNPISHYRAKPPIGQTREDLKGYFAVPWHQDSAVIVEESDASDILTCWIPLVDVTEEMGCLQVLPGGHRQGHLPHVNAAGYGTSIKPSAMPPGHPVKLSVHVGDVVFMHRHCPHHSGPNRSERCRWSFDMRYHRTGDNSGRPWQPEVEVRSSQHAIVPDHSSWSRAWEQCIAEKKSGGQHRTVSES